LQGKLGNLLNRTSTVVYITLDSSPQGGYDWLQSSFTLLEESVLLTAFDAATELCNRAQSIDCQESVICESSKALKWEPGVPVAIGSGRASVAHKLHAFIHSLRMVCPTWLLTAVRHCWLQEQLAKGSYTMKKVVRECNPSDMMTHAPSAAELQKFLPMVGVYEKSCADGAVEIVKTALASRPSSGVKLAAAVLAHLTGQAKAGAISVIGGGDIAAACQSEICLAEQFQSVPHREQADWQYILAMMVFVAGFVLAVGVYAGWKLRVWWESSATQSIGAVAPQAQQSAISAAPRSPRGLAGARPYTVATRTVSTQSQTRYSFATKNPRFVPLPDHEQGCWELAR
jgi:hypothetical protein